MREVCQTDSRQLQVLQIDEWHCVAIEERHILSVNVEDIVRWLFNIERLQVGTGVHQTRKDKVVGRDEFQRMNMLSHIGNVGWLLRQCHMELKMK